MILFQMLRPFSVYKTLESKINFKFLAFSELLFS
jgi:hypothetical protein